MPFEAAQSPSPPSNGRMQSLDIVRAAAIVFVILGHALIYANCANFLMSCIYSFHMAQLFAISGFVTAASWECSGAATPRTALRKIGRSARRLLVPYALCGIALMPMVNVMQTGRFVESFINGWRNAFLLNRFLWYLPCCFFLICIFVTVTLATRRIDSKRWIAASGAAFAAVCAAHLLLPVVDYLRSMMNYMPAFFAGAWLWTRRDDVLNPGRRLLTCTSIAFVALALLFAAIPEIPHFNKNIMKPIVGIFALFPFVAIAKKAKGLLATGAAHVGRMTLFLYCFDFFATPISVWYLQPGGILSSLSIAFGVVAIGVFINFAWEYAILPELQNSKK